MGAHPKDLGALLGADWKNEHKEPPAGETVLALTDAKIRALKPKDKAYKVSDFGGLYINVTKKGSKLWRLKYRFQGKEGKLSFGPYPGISLKEARTRRDEAKSQLANGQNPAEVKREAQEEALEKTEHTFNKVADQFVHKVQKDGRSKATLRKLEWLLEDARADFGQLPIRTITPPIVLKTLRKREKLGHYETAHRMRSRIGAIFRFAVASGIAENDPTFALRDALIRPKVTHRAAIVDEQGLTDLLRGIESYTGHSTTKIGLKLLLQFACRPGELRKAKWEEFDLSESIWSIPSERMKMRRPHQVPLTEESISLLTELQEISGWGELLFPATTSSKRPMSENTFNQALRRMGFGPDEVTSHGFRSTFSTFANESGLWSPDVIEAYCARQDRNAVRRAYNRSLYWEERVRLAGWWETKIHSLQSIRPLH